MLSEAHYEVHMWHASCHDTARIGDIDNVMLQLATMPRPPVTFLCEKLWIFTRTSFFQTWWKMVDFLPQTRQHYYRKKTKWRKLTVHLWSNSNRSIIFHIMLSFQYVSNFARGFYYQVNLILSTELITLIGHREEFKSWRFERYPFDQSLWRKAKARNVSF